MPSLFQNCWNLLQWLCLSRSMRGVQEVTLHFIFSRMGNSGDTALVRKCSVDYKKFIKRYVWQVGISMEFTQTSPFECEVRSIIQFLLKDLKWFGGIQFLSFPRVRINLGLKWFSKCDELITRVSDIMWNSEKEFYRNGI